MEGVVVECGVETCVLACGTVDEDVLDVVSLEKGVVGPKGAKKCKGLDGRTAGTCEGIGSMASPSRGVGGA